MLEDKNKWPSNLKKTKHRQCVLSILENAKKPLSAMEVFSDIEESGDTIWLSTIYRILDLFVKNNMVLKINVMDSDVALYELNHFVHKHYAICIGCNKIIAMENCPMEAFIPKVNDSDFHVIGHNLEIYGYCKNCQPRK